MRWPKHIEFQRTELRLLGCPVSDKKDRPEAGSPHQLPRSLHRAIPAQVVLRRGKALKPDAWGTLASVTSSAGLHPRFGGFRVQLTSTSKRKTKPTFKIQQFTHNLIRLASPSPNHQSSLNQPITIPSKCQKTTSHPPSSAGCALAWSAPSS